MRLVRNVLKELAFSATSFTTHASVTEKIMTHLALMIIQIIVNNNKDIIVIFIYIIKIIIDDLRPQLVTPASDSS